MSRLIVDGNKKTRFKTVDFEKFIENEFERAFKRTFKSIDIFKTAMGQFAVTCGICKCWYWKACTPPCDCIYNVTILKMINHDKT